MSELKKKVNHEDSKAEIKYPFGDLEKLAARHKISAEELDELATKDKERRREVEANWAEMEEEKERMKVEKESEPQETLDPEMAQYDKYSKIAKEMPSSKIAHFNRNKSR